MTGRDIAYYIIMVFVVVCLIFVAQKAYQRDAAVAEALEECINYYEELISEMEYMDEEDWMNTIIFTEKYNASKDYDTMP